MKYICQLREISAIFSTIPDKGVSFSRAMH